MWLWRARASCQGHTQPALRSTLSAGRTLQLWHGRAVRQRQRSTLLGLADQGVHPRHDLSIPSMRLLGLPCLEDGVRQPATHQCQQFTVLRTLGQIRLLPDSLQSGFTAHLGPMSSDLGSPTSSTLLTALQEAQPMLNPRQVHTLAVSLPDVSILL